MDTSDSEYFESADEEIYPDDKTSQKHHKIVNETQKDLVNLNIVDCSTKSTENQEIHIKNTLNNALNVDMKSAQFPSYTADRSQTETERSSDPKELLKQEESQRSQSENEHLQIDDDNNESSNFNLPNKLSTLDTQHNLVTDIESKETSSNENVLKLSKDVEKKDASEVSHDVNSDSNTNKEIGNKEETQKLSDAEENMWENDDWEPVSYEKDIKGEDDQQINELIENKVESVEDKVDVDMWENDDWESFEKVEPNRQEQTSEAAWSGWGNWGGMSSIFTTATQGVTTLTSQVSQGLSTVLENSMGIPDPKELAKLDREQESIVAQHQEESTDRTNIGFGFGNLSNLVSGVSHITKFVESTSNKVITGGLDTLETIGKKTMEVLQEGDPGLKNKRALLKLDKEKPILSQVLREAKEKAERENQVLQEKHSKKKMNYETLFDDYHGLVHLEALEMLSKQCDIKLQTLSETCSGNEFQELQETMDQIKELCELPDEDDDDTPTIDDIKEKIQVAVKDINVAISYARLFSIWEETDVWLNNLKLDFCDEYEIHQEAMQILAQLTAIAVEQFHKCGELLLIKEHRSTADEADSLVQLTMTLTSLIGLVAGRFSEKLNMKSSQSGNRESVNSLITNVFFEAGNSSSYIQDAFQLLIPVLQVGAV